MDALYLVLLLMFFALVSALAVGCAHLQARRGALRPGAASGTPSTARNSG
jgi:hypothetical protein